MAAGLRMEIVKKLIAARIERPDEHNDVLAGGDDFLAVQLVAFEFGRGPVVVVDDELDLDAGRNLNLARNELIVLQRNRKARIIGQRRRRQSQNKQSDNRYENTHQRTPADANAN